MWKTLCKTLQSTCVPRNHNRRQINVLFSGTLSFLIGIHCYFGTYKFIHLHEFYGQTDCKGWPPLLAVSWTWFFSVCVQKTDVFFSPKALFSALFSGSKVSHLPTVRAEGADPTLPPYGQPDRKISGFFLLTPRSMKVVFKEKAFLFANFDPQNGG